MLAALFLCVNCSDSTSETPPTNPEEENPEEEVVQAEPYRINRMLIKHGLQLQCWVATDNLEMGIAAGQPNYEMLPADWALTGFTGPTFYGPPLINPSFFKTYPESQWAIAKAPYGEHLEIGPTKTEKRQGFLSETQKAHLNKLTTICFGDEEHYDLRLVQILKDWYDLSRHHYPDVLLHNNQYIGQWNESQMRTYIRTAKPDLITYDWYYFRTEKPDDYIGAKEMAEDLQTYRKLAMEGWKGDNTQYITFGQYLEGYIYDGTYKISESQLRLYYYLTWTLGGKWVNWFRYMQGNGALGQTSPNSWSLLLKNGMPGQPSEYMDIVNLCNTESKYISNYLVRLKTSDVRFAAGTEKYTEGKPNNISAFSAVSSPIKSVSSEFLSEPGEGSDLYIGFYDIIPEEEQGDPTFFSHGEKEFFMITNGFASKTEKKAEPLTQKIRFGINMKEADATRCSWINPANGKLEDLKPIQTEKDINYYEVKLWGGTGALFILSE